MRVNSLVCATEWLLRRSFRFLLGSIAFSPALVKALSIFPIPAFVPVFLPPLLVIGLTVLFVFFLPAFKVGAISLPLLWS
jgi:hypothetical protein